MTAEKSHSLSYFLIFFVPACVVTGSLLFYIYSIEVHSGVERIRSEELSKIVIQEQMVKKYFHEIIGDLKLLSKLHELKNFQKTARAAWVIWPVIFTSSPCTKDCMIRSGILIPPVWRWCG